MISQLKNTIARSFSTLRNRENIPINVSGSNLHSCQNSTVANTEDYTPHNSMESVETHLRFLNSRIPSVYLLMMLNLVSIEKLLSPFVPRKLFGEISEWHKKIILIEAIEVENSNRLETATNKLNHDPAFDGYMPDDVGKSRHDQIILEPLIECGIDQREKTFKDFPHLKYLSLDGILVEEKNGMYYLKCVTCYKDIPMEQLNENYLEDMHFSFCYFEKRKEKFKVSRKSRNSSFSSFGMDPKTKETDVQLYRRHSISNYEIECRMDSNDITKVEKLGYQRSTIRNIVERELWKTGESLGSHFELITKIKKYYAQKLNVLPFI